MTSRPLIFPGQAFFDGILWCLDGIFKIFKFWRSSKQRFMKFDGISGPKIRPPNFPGQAFLDLKRCTNVDEMLSTWSYAVFGGTSNTVKMPYKRQQKVCLKLQQNIKQILSKCQQNINKI